MFTHGIDLAKDIARNCGVVAHVDWAENTVTLTSQDPDLIALAVSRFNKLEEFYVTPLLPASMSLSSLFEMCSFVGPPGVAVHILANHVPSSRGVRTQSRNQHRRPPYALHQQHRSLGRRPNRLQTSRLCHLFHVSCPSNFPRDWDLRYAGV